MGTEPEKPALALGEFRRGGREEGQEGARENALDFNIEDTQLEAQRSFC